MTGNSGVEFAPARELGFGRGVPPPVTANDPRIPPPSPDLAVFTEPGVPPILVTPGGQPIASQPQVSENEGDVMRKYGIYSAKGDDFVVSCLDDDNDPIESRRFDALSILEKVKPLLEAAGHKVVDYTSGDLQSSASGGKVTTLRRRKAVSE